MLLDIAARRADFRALHEDGYFLLPTAWDIGGAKRIEALGYAGVATTISSLAWTLGRDVKDISRDDVLRHLRQLVSATEIAVNADYGFGFATNPLELIDNVHMAIDTGVAALCIGDRIGDELVAIDAAVSRLEACRCAIESSGADVLLVARSECPLIGNLNVKAAIARLSAFSSAGADVLVLPGLNEPDVIEAAVKALAPRALDIPLAAPGLNARELGQLGVRRISVGDAFADAAWASFDRVAGEFIDYGDVAPECVPALDEAAH